jgi:hypothetical protein
VLTRNGVTVAKIVKHAAPKVAPPGTWQGKVAYSADWNSAETNAEIENLFTDSQHAPTA